MKPSRDVQYYLDLCEDQGFRMVATKHGHRVFAKDQTKGIIQVPFRFGSGPDETQTRTRLRAIGIVYPEDIKPARTSPEPIPVPIDKARPVIGLKVGLADMNNTISPPTDPLTRIATLIARVGKVADDLIAIGTMLKQLVSDLETEALNVDTGNEKLRNLAKALEALRP